MKTLKCLIVDDEEMSRKILIKHCEKVDFIEVVGVCKDGAEALNAINEHSIDLLFLDIEMPNLSGMELIEALEVKPYIILTTSREDYAVKAFEFRVFDYLVKPIEFNRFLKSVHRLVQASEVKEDFQGTMLSKEHFYVKIDSRLVKIDFDKLLLAKAKGDYVTLYLKDANHVVHTTLKSIQTKLPTDFFLQVHRSYIVNLREIVDIEDSSILIGEEIVPISRANRNELLKRLNTL